MNASFKQIDTLKLFIALKMAHSCCFSFRGNLDFPEFLQKKIYNINYSSSCFATSSVTSFTLDPLRCEPSAVAQPDFAINLARLNKIEFTVLRYRLLIYERTELETLQTCNYGHFLL